MKSNVFHLANALRKSGLSLSEAVRRAWASLKLKAEMLVKPTSFFYKKKDGEERFAVGFYGAAPATKTVTTARRSDEKPENLTAIAVKYYDTLAGGWRSFRADRLILTAL